jgi:molybdate transport system substrate-binding protein
MKYILILIFLGFAGILVSAPTVRAAESVLRVAAAADLQFVLPEIKKAFEAEHPDTEIKISFGASGTLTAQITKKAPFDLFLSADSDYPEALVRQGFAPEAASFEYCQGRLVLWVAESFSKDLNKKGLKVLLDPSIHKIAIANPEHAPYGKAAIAVLKSQAMLDVVQSRLVIGENISQAAQYLETHAADAGFIAESLARSTEMNQRGKFIGIAAGDYPAIHQMGVILKSSANKELALTFKRFIIGPRGREIFHRFGYGTQKSVTGKPN